MIDKEIEAGIQRACECDCAPPSTGWTVNPFPIIRDYIERLKRRAEIAERALREFAVQVGCRSCPYKGRCDISNPSAENDYQECYEVALRIAEKELAEEKNEQV